MEFPELVSEEKHVENLLFVRELIKLKIDNWVETKQDGNLVDFDCLIEKLEQLDLTEDCISNLRSRIQLLEEKDKIDALENKLTKLEHQHNILKHNFITKELENKIEVKNGIKH